MKFRKMMVIIAAWLGLLATTQAASAPEIVLVYWSSRDCSWCATWESERHGMQASLKKAPEFKQARYRVIKNDRLVDAYVDEDFPPDMKWLKDRLERGEEAQPRRPSWVVYVNQVRVAGFYGVRDWATHTLPEIRRLIGRYASGAEKVEAGGAASSRGAF
jgi:hypothetical protein